MVHHNSRKRRLIHKKSTSKVGRGSLSTPREWAHPRECQWVQQPVHALGYVVLPRPSVFRPGRQSALQLRGSCVLHNHVRVRRHSWSLSTHAHRLLSAHRLVRLLLKRPLLRINTGCGEVGVVRRGVCTIAECAASTGQTNLSVRRRRIHSTGPQHAMEPSLEAKARLVAQTTALCTHEASGDPRQTMTGRQPVQRQTRRQTTHQLHHWVDDLHRHKQRGVCDPAPRQQDGQRRVEPPLATQGHGRVHRQSEGQCLRIHRIRREAGVDLSMHNGGDDTPAKCPKWPQRDACARHDRM